MKTITIRPDGKFGDIKIICPCGYMEKTGAGHRDPEKLAIEHNKTKHGNSYTIRYER